MKQPSDRVMLHAFGPATLLKEYEHRDTKEIVWYVQSDAGERFCLSQAYVQGLEIIKERK